MPRGDKSAYTNKQKRQAEHIEEGYESRGVSEKEAERRAWATVNATTHGGKKSGSGRVAPRIMSLNEKADASVGTVRRAKRGAERLGKAGRRAGATKGASRKLAT